MKNFILTAVFFAGLSVLAGVTAGCKQHPPPPVGKSPSVAYENLLSLLVDANRVEYDITDDYDRYGPIVIVDGEQVRQIVEHFRSMTDVQKNAYPFTGVVSGEYATLTFVRKSPLRCVRVRIVGERGVMFPESEQYQGLLPDENLWYALLRGAEQHKADHPEDVIRR